MVILMDLRLRSEYPIKTQWEFLFELRLNHQTDQHKETMKVEFTYSKIYKQKTSINIKLNTS